MLDYYKPLLTQLSVTGPPNTHFTVRQAMMLFRLGSLVIVPTRLRTSSAHIRSFSKLATCICSFQGLCPSECGQQVYNMTLTSSFNRSTHRHYPRNGLVGMMYFFVHDKDLRLFSIGEKASLGVAGLAHYGGVRNLRAWSSLHQNRLLNG